jgi:hypothetical protein
MSLRYTAERVTKFASAVHKIAYFTVEYLRKFEDIFKKAFPRLSGAYGELFDEIKKKPEVENLVSGSRSR